MKPGNLKLLVICEVLLVTLDPLGMFRYSLKRIVGVKKIRAPDASVLLPGNVYILTSVTDA